MAGHPDLTAGLASWTDIFPMAGLLPALVLVADDLARTSQPVPPPPDVASGTFDVAARIIPASNATLIGIRKQEEPTASVP